MRGLIVSLDTKMSADTIQMIVELQVNPREGLHALWMRRLQVIVIPETIQRDIRSLEVLIPRHSN